MKPATDALFNWMKVLMTNEEFTYCNFWHHHFKPGTKVPAASMPHDFRITKWDVPDWNHEGRQDPLLALNLITDRTNINVYLWVKRPDVLRALGDDYHKNYTGLKLKDLIDFMEMFNNSVEGQDRNNLQIYYINPYEKDNRIYTKDFVKHNQQMVDNHKIFVDALFDFFDKRVKQNEALKNVKKDFK